MSLYAPERLDARGINLASRVVSSKAIVGSPALAAETIVASVTLPLNVQTFNAVELLGMVAFTGGTSGISADVKIRQTDTSGSTIVDSGALTVIATDLYAFTVAGLDAAPAAGQVYKLTLTIGSGAAVSTVSAVYLRAMIV